MLGRNRKLIFSDARSHRIVTVRVGGGRVMPKPQVASSHIVTIFSALHLFYDFFALAAVLCVLALPFAIGWAEDV